MTVSDLISLFSGVALFLFGMSLMGDSLKQVAGNRLEGLLYKLTNTRWKAVLLGTAVTAVIQSSAATSVMAVGFVNAGMMRVSQAVGIILGAIFGTSVTGWVVALSGLSGGSGWISLLSTSTLTGLVAVAGTLLRMTARRATEKHTGDILLGFSVLMLGMNIMGDAVAPLKESPEFVGTLTAFSNPVLGILAGTVLAAILQSSSAAVGIVQAMALTGSVTFAVAFPLLLGIGIGSSAPVLMSAAGAGIDGKRTAATYLLINLFGAVLTAVPFYVLNACVSFGFLDMPLNMFEIAALNTGYRFVTLMVLIPCVGMLETVSRLTVKAPPDELPEETSGPVLEERFLRFPALALTQCREQMGEMAKLSRKSVTAALDAVHEYQPKTLERVRALENRLDRYEDALSNYILRLTKLELTTVQNQIFTRYLHAVSDFERISDHAWEIALTAKDMNENGVTFSGNALGELAVLERALREILNQTVEAFTGDDLDKAETVDPCEEAIDRLCERMKARHVERMKSGECTFLQGIAFNDLINGYEEVADHCSNVALTMLETEGNSVGIHASPYHDASRETRFARLYEQYQKQFSLDDAP